MKFKEFIITLIKKISNILLVISTLGLIASIVLLSMNQAIESGMLVELADNPFMQWLTLERIGTATAYLGGIVTAGSIAKVAGSTLKRVVESSKSELEKQALFYDTKIDKVKNESINATVVMSEQLNQLTDIQRENALLNKQILEVMLVTARRNINSNLVSHEDKKLYREFISNVSKSREPNLNNIYMTIVEKTNKTNNDEEDADERDFLTKIIEKEEEHKGE